MTCPRIEFQEYAVELCGPTSFTFYTTVAVGTATHKDLRIRLEMHCLSYVGAYISAVVCGPPLPPVTSRLSRHKYTPQSSIKDH